MRFRPTSRFAAKLEPGETVLVSGATDNLGSAAVVVTLGMGATCVGRAGPQTKPCWPISSEASAAACVRWLTGDENDDRQRMKRAAPGGIDCVMDILPPSASATAVSAAITAVRPCGRALRRDALGGTGLDLSYPWIMRSCITIHGELDVFAGGHRQANQPDPFAADRSRLNQSEAMARR